jgi:hypothetical protein
MNRPILVLQYPDSRQARTVALAATRSSKALFSFKEAVLEEARLKLMDWETDDILRLQEEMEFERLERLLNLLIPSNEPDEKH